jgi:hypothetical protein
MGDEKKPLDKHSHSRNTINVRSDSLNTGFTEILKPVLIFNKNKTHAFSTIILKNIGWNWS